jgi:hypothetical protein
MTQDNRYQEAAEQFYALIRQHIGQPDSTAGVGLRADRLAAEVLTKLASGWVLVPAKPTQEMISKGGYINSEWLNDNAPIGQQRYERPVAEVYKAMIAAAPDAGGPNG